jgi:signal transduction histidine kinase
LSEANERLRADMDLQKRFLASVSHELKTPVSRIRGFAESLALGMEKSPRERTELAGIIINEADRLARLVSDITFVVRMESGALPLQRRSVDAAEVLRQSVGRFAIEARKAGVTLSTAVDGTTVLDADPDRLPQVMDNLLANALRHTPAGGSVALGVEPGDAAVRFTVGNRGSPIPAEHLPHLFQAFYRVEDARSRTAARRAQ